MPFTRDTVNFPKPTLGVSVGFVLLPLPLSENILTHISHNVNVKSGSQIKHTLTPNVGFA